MLLGQKIFNEKALQILKQKRLCRKKLTLGKRSKKNNAKLSWACNSYDHTRTFAKLLTILLLLLVSLTLILIYIGDLDWSSIGPKNEVFFKKIHLVLNVIPLSSSRSTAINGGSTPDSLLYKLFENLLIG